MNHMGFLPKKTRNWEAKLYECPNNDENWWYNKGEA